MITTPSARDPRKALIVLVPLSFALVAAITAFLPGSEAPQPPSDLTTSVEGARPPATQPMSAPASRQAPEGSRIRQATYASLLEMARDLIAHGSSPEAIEWLQKAIRIFPNEADAFHLMGDALLQLGYVRDARQHYMDAIDRNPAHADAYFGFGMAAEALGDIASALHGMRGYLHAAGDAAAPQKADFARARIATLEAARTGN